MYNAVVPGMPIWPITQERGIHGEKTKPFRERKGFTGVANASFLGRKITTSLAKEILKAYVQLYQKEITIEHIIEVVCGYLALDPERFNSPERTREIAQARQIAMYLAKQHTKAPLATIGAAIGGRNHATVLHSCKAVSNLLETDKAFRRQVEEIEKQVLA